jgi:Putative addiction module component
MTIDELMREALQLDPSTRASFARELLNSLESLTDGEVEQLWVEEAVRRDAELDAGVAGTVSAEDALARARARRG